MFRRFLGGVVPDVNGSQPRRKRRKLTAVAAIAAVILTAGGCSGNNEEASSGDTVKLAFVGPLTGDAANLGINARNAAKLAVKEANDAGGVQIELVEYDTKGDPADATTVKDRFINDADVIGVVGGIFSGETKAILPDLQSNGLVMISPSATNVDLPNVVPDQTVFHRIIPDDDAQSRGLSEYLIKKLEAKRVAYVHDNSDYGKPLTESLEKLASQGGVTTAVEDAVDPKSQDFSAAVNQVKTAAPEVVFYGGYYTEAGRFRKQLTDAGVTAKFLSADGAFDPGFISAAGEAADGAQISCPCSLASEDTPGKVGEFAKAYKELNGAEPGTYSPEGYDAAKILAEGIKAGNTERETLLDYVENMGAFQGVSKDAVEFEPNGNVKSTGVFFYEVKDGKMTVLGNTDTLI